jgi:hypothetical protein
MSLGWGWSALIAYPDNSGTRLIASFCKCAMQGCILHDDEDMTSDLLSDSTAQ